MLYTCDLCDLLFFNKMQTNLYGIVIVSTTVWDYQRPRQCENIYYTQSGSRTMRVKTSLSLWGGVTVTQCQICLRSSTETANSLRNPGVRYSPSYVCTVYTVYTYSYSSNIWNHVCADQRTIACDVKWQVIYGQNTVRK